MATRLFVGFSGPIGYDYWRGGSRPQHSATPNAVLEDVTGLLVCYDELYFLSRDFCPMDMWDLPYVKFLSDDSETLARALTAHDQATEWIAEFGSLGWGDISRTFSRTIAAMTHDDMGSGIDNHSRGLAHVEGFKLGGNSANTDAVLTDRLIATSLELPNLDVLTNTVASEAMQQLVIDPSPPKTFDDWHVDVASLLGTVRVPNQLGPEGGYHEEVEELRAHPQVRAFRDYLSNLVPGVTPPEDAAKEVSEAADDYARQLTQKKHAKRPIYKTVGRGAIGAVLDAAVPLLGTVSGGALDIVNEISARRSLRDTAWASFVVSLKK